MRTREALSALIEGRMASPAGRSELVELATRLIVEEALEGEVRDALDRGYYEHGAAPGQGHRNGHRTQRLKTAEGGLEYSAPQVAGLEQPFRSALRDHLSFNVFDVRQSAAAPNPLDFDDQSKPLMMPHASPDRHSRAVLKGLRRDLVRFF